jgi:hypothetical protein
MTLHVPTLALAADPLIAEAKPRKRRSRLLVAVGAVMLVGGAATATVAVHGSERSRPAVVLACGPPLGAIRAGLLPTVAHPLSCAHRVTLANAAASLGVHLVLPKTTLVRPSEVGPVWSVLERRKHGVVAVTFPTQGVIVQYERPVPFSGKAQAHFRRMAQGMRADGLHAKIVDLNGTAAFAIQQDFDSNRNNFGVVTFKLGDSEVRVMAHRDQPTLRALARSILSQSKASRATAKP